MGTACKQAPSRCEKETYLLYDLFSQPLYIFGVMYLSLQGCSTPSLNYRPYFSGTEQCHRSIIIRINTDWLLSIHERTNKKEMKKKKKKTLNHMGISNQHIMYKMSKHIQQGSSSSTPKDIIIVIIIEALPRGNLRSFPGIGRIIKPNVQQTNLEPVIADQVN